MPQVSSKKELRLAMVTRRRSVDHHLQRTRSERACICLLDLLKGAERIGVYAAVRGELDLSLFIARTGAQIAFPRAWPATHRLTFHWSSECPKTTGAYGIAEPSVDSPVAAPELLQVILVPGAAFTTKGGRLGMGGGYYDRYLKTLPSSVLIVGVGYDWQIVPCVFSETHDITMTHVLTEERTICVAEAALSRSM